MPTPEDKPATPSTPATPAKPDVPAVPDPAEERLGYRKDDNGKWIPLDDGDGDADDGVAGGASDPPPGPPGGGV